MIGSPGSPKTPFLTEILRMLSESLFVVGGNTTRAGLINQLFEIQAKVLLIDELEKMNKIDQTAFLHLMETGIISETKINKTRRIHLSTSVFASANSCKTISSPLLSRFLVLNIPDYTYEKFHEVATIKLSKDKIDKKLVDIIVHKVWNELGSKDIRDVIKVAKLVSCTEEVSLLVKMMKK
ncbi:hypothetical protein BH18THE1_BH18THE1_18580 [soil metagenome]